LLILWIYDFSSQLFNLIYISVFCEVFWRYCIIFVIISMQPGWWLAQMNPTYRPSLLEKDGVLPFAASDLVLSPSQWSSHVVGINSSRPHFNSGLCFDFFFFKFSWHASLLTLSHVWILVFSQEKLVLGLTWIQRMKHFGWIPKPHWNKK
jgi:hypothetical protein